MGLDGIRAYVVDIAVGPAHSLATPIRVKYMRGEDYAGRLGLGSGTGNIVTPTKVSFFSTSGNTGNADAITVGGSSSYVVRNDGFIYAFGENSYGQLGNGESAYEYDNAADSFKYSPVQVSGKDLTAVPDNLVMVAGNTANIDVTVSDSISITTVQPSRQASTGR